MNILIIGNSQAGCLKKALDHSSESMFPTLKIADWIVTPGGTGPYLEIKDNKLVVTRSDPRFPPRFTPSSDILDIDINQYSAIVICALGYIDGGFYYYNPISADKYFPISSFAHNIVCENQYPISQSCFKDVAKNRLSMQPGFMFFDELKRLYKGKIFVQPFPMLSSKIKTHENWHLAKIYEDPIPVNHFLLDLKDKFLNDICDYENIYLLPYPDESWRTSGFTPSEFILDSDYLHPNNLYGSLVLTQFEKLIDSMNQAQHIA